jgi:hypothetical protein
MVDARKSHEVCFIPRGLFVFSEVLQYNPLTDLLAVLNFAVPPKTSLW